MYLFSISLSLRPIFSPVHRGGEGGSTVGEKYIVHSIDSFGVLNLYKCTLLYLWIFMYLNLILSLFFLFIKTFLKINKSENFI